ncbi:MAG: hypothetical protein IPK12_23490 [Gemmatimonadetes bacterium]|nr:hypothetical protein [Gemmatimonadota bacterium]
MSTGTRKYRIAMAGLALGALLALGAFVLAMRARLTADYVAVVSAVAGLIGVCVGAFAAGNAVEHWSRKGAPPDGT